MLNADNIGMSSSNHLLRYLIVDIGEICAMDPGTTADNDEKLKHWGQATVKVTEFFKKMIEKHTKLKTISTIIQDTYGYWPKTILCTVFETEFLKKKMNISRKNPVKNRTLVSSTIHTEVKGNPLFINYDVKHAAGMKKDEDVSYREFLILKYPRAVRMGLGSKVKKVEDENCLADYTHFKATYFKVWVEKFRLIEGRMSPYLLLSKFCVHLFFNNAQYRHFTHSTQMPHIISLGIIIFY